MQAVAVAMAMWAGASFAQVPPSSTRAEQLFRHARAMLAEKNYVDACPLLEQSHKLEPALGTLLNLADCLENLGKLASAQRAFLQAAEWASRTQETKRREVALARAQALDARVAKVVVTLDKPPADAKVELRAVDGSVVESPLEPGRYLAVASASGFLPREQAFEVGQPPVLVALTVPALESIAAQPTAVLTPAVPAEVKTVTPALTPSRPNTGSSGRKTVATVLLVSGGVVGIASLVGLVWSGDVLARVERQQPGGPDAANPTVTRGEFAIAQPINGASIAGAIAGGLAIATGVTLLALGSPDEKLAAGVVVTPGGAMATVGGRF